MVAALKDKQISLFLLLPLPKVKHGGSSVRVHPCRLIPYSKIIPTTNPQEFNVETSDNGQKNMSNVDQIPLTDLRSRFDDSELPNEDVKVD